MLSRRRIVLAFAAAVVGDAIQLGLLQFGWMGVDEVIDVVLMVVISVLIGFHPLFLPTFVAEFLPIVDLLPTWTGCVALVVALRRKAERAAPRVISPTDSIDI